MPSIKVITPLMAGRYYHIFNWGINRQTIFYSHRNYLFFLKLLDQYLSSYIDVLAYCLLPNHFHLVIKVREEITVGRRDSIFHKDGILIKDEEGTGNYVSNQFRKFFISYSMAINKQENRTGSLFDKNFKRLEIENEEYLRYAVFYTHYNPQKHGYETDFKNYKFSSYKAILSAEETRVNRELVKDLFGGEHEFLEYHKFVQEEKEAIILE